jgi:hypothetical protein
VVGQRSTLRGFKFLDYMFCKLWSLESVLLGVSGEMKLGCKNIAVIVSANELFYLLHHVNTSSTQVGNGKLNSIFQGCETDHCLFCSNVSRLFVYFL